MMSSELKIAKRQQRDQRRQKRREDRRHGRAMMRCFWTYPFGHVWEESYHFPKNCRFCPATNYGNTEQLGG